MQPGNDGTSVSWSKLRGDAEKAMQPLPKGVRVPVAVEKAKYQKASTGAHMVVATLVIFEGEHSPRKVFNNFVLSPDSPFAVQMFFRNMSAFGLDDGFFTKLEGSGVSIEQQLEMIGDALVNRKAWLTMDEPRTYQGVTRDNPGQFEPYAGQQAINFAGGVPVSASSGAAAGGPPSVPQTSATPAAAPTGDGAPPPVPSF